MSLPCKIKIIPGPLENYSGQRVESCDDCGDCVTKGYIRNVGMVDSISIKMIGEDVSLHWSCPSCGHDVKEETTPIDAIPLAGEIKLDPLCHYCRNKGAR